MSDCVEGNVLSLVLMQGSLLTTIAFGQTLFLKRLASGAVSNSISDAKPVTAVAPPIFAANPISSASASFFRGDDNPPSLASKSFAVADSISISLPFERI